MHVTYVPVLLIRICKFINVVGNRSADIGLLQLYFFYYRMLKIRFEILKFMKLPMTVFRKCI